MERVRLYLSPAEYTALFRLSDQELRSVASQARALVREGLTQRGLLAEEQEAGDRIVEVGPERVEIRP